MLLLKWETSEVNTRLAYFNIPRECCELYFSLAVTSGKVSRGIVCFCNASQVLPLNHYFNRYSCMDFHQAKNNVIYEIISLQITNGGGNLKVDL